MKRRRKNSFAHTLPKKKKAVAPEIPLDAQLDAGMVNGGRVNAGKGVYVEFHGAFKDKEKAVEKERKTKGAFIQPRYIRGQKRFVVMSARRNPGGGFIPVQLAANLIQKMFEQRGGKPFHINSGGRRQKKGARRRNKETGIFYRGLLIVKRKGKYVIPKIEGVEFGTLAAAKAYIDAQFNRNPSLFSRLVKKVSRARHGKALRRRLIRHHTARARRAARKSSPQSSPSSQRKQSSGRGLHPEDLPASVQEQLRRQGVINPSAAAAQAYKKFIGKAPSSEDEISETLRYQEDLAMMGYLVELHVHGKRICFDPESARDRVMLCQNPEGAQLYFVGGNQDLDSAARSFHLDLSKDEIDFGPVSQIHYWSKKYITNYDGEIYWHKLGEEDGRRPSLIYDRINKKMRFAGGAYKIKHEGIVN